MNKIRMNELISCFLALGIAAERMGFLEIWDRSGHGQISRQHCSESWEFVYRSYLNESSVETCRGFSPLVVGIFGNFEWQHWVQ